MFHQKKKKNNPGNKHDDSATKHTETNHTINNIYQLAFYQTVLFSYFSIVIFKIKQVLLFCVTKQDQNADYSWILSMTLDLSKLKTS